MRLLWFYFFSFLFGISIALWKPFIWNGPSPFLKNRFHCRGKGTRNAYWKISPPFVFFRLTMEDHGRMLLLIPWLSVALWVCHRQPNKKEINNPGTRKVVWNKATKTPRLHYSVELTFNASTSHDPGWRKTIICTSLVKTVNAWRILFNTWLLLQPSAFLSLTKKRS